MISISRNIKKKKKKKDIGPHLKKKVWQKIFAQPFLRKDHLSFERDFESLGNYRSTQQYIDIYRQLSVMCRCTQTHQDVQHSDYRAAFVDPGFNVKTAKKVNEGTSVGEMLGILSAVQWVEEIKPLETIICSDSRSSSVT